MMIRLISHAASHSSARVLRVSLFAWAFIACASPSPQTPPHVASSASSPSPSAASAPVASHSTEAPTPSAPYASESTPPQSVTSTDAHNASDINEPTSASNPTESLDITIARAVKEKSGHKACYYATLERHPGFKPVHYELVVTILAEGRVKRVEVDKKMTVVSTESFIDCIKSNLLHASFPPPGREISARLIWP